jgi:hypothetical protein
MITSSSLIKSSLHNSVAESVFNEISNRSSRYYYFLGKTLTWEDEDLPPSPVDSLAYEFATRNEIITMKEIKPTDVAFVVSRYNWLTNTVYDQYDDQYSKEVQGFNLTSGGTLFASAPNVWVGSQGSVLWTENTVLFEGAFIKVAVNSSFRYYIVTTGGTTGTIAPTHTEGTQTNGTCSFTHVVVSDGGGEGASATCTVLDGKVIDVQLISRGDGYITPPSVYIAGGGGAGVICEAVVNIAPSGTQKLEDSVFYVITDEFNVYKCLDNNNGGFSQYKPIGTTVDPVTFPDGYMWKFLYNVPIALRNKFLTDEYMPVVNALRNQFYSGGIITTIKVDQPGTGYSSATITVQGDGYLESDPLYVTNAVVATEGANYTDPTLIITPPFTNVSSWLQNTSYFLGQRLSYSGNIYEVAIAGVTASLEPTHTVGIVSNGTAALKYLGTTATGLLTVDGGEITAVTMLGILRDVTIIDGGLGYLTAPTVNISGATGSGGAGIAVLQNSSVSKVILSALGSGYITAPSITFGTQWQQNTVLSPNDQIYFSNRLYTVTVGGTTGSTAPNHLSGSAANGTTTLVYAGRPATGSLTIKYGAGYSSTPSATIADSIGSTGSGAAIQFQTLKSEAKLVPIIASNNIGSEWKANTTYATGQIIWYNSNLYNVSVAGTTATTPPTHSGGSAFNGTAVLEFTSEFGKIISVQIDDGGIGYTSAVLSVTGDGSGAQISADLSPGDVNTLQANNELLTIDGRIMNIAVVSQGYGYAAANVTITGDGTGATAVAVIGSSGNIEKINITNYGQGYRWAVATITGNGFGAKVRVIISPYGGHGKFVLNGLNARTLMFFSNISSDKNQGFDVNNDYRQLGIIKNPTRFQSTAPLTNILASACWVITGSISTTFFPIDSIIYESETGKRFRIVTNNGNAILAQSLDNYQPQIGTTFTNDQNYTFVAAAVSTPNSDKYSGDMMFIDNKRGFTPTADQSVTLRTVIRF